MVNKKYKSLYIVNMTTNDVIYDLKYDLFQNNIFKKSPIGSVFFAKNENEKNMGKITVILSFSSYPVNFQYIIYIVNSNN